MSALQVMKEHSFDTFWHNIQQKIVCAPATGVKVCWNSIYFVKFQEQLSNVGKYTLCVQYTLISLVGVVM